MLTGVAFIRNKNLRYLLIYKIILNINNIFMKNTFFRKCFEKKDIDLHFIILF